MIGTYFEIWNSSYVMYFRYLLKRQSLMQSTLLSCKYFEVFSLIGCLNRKKPFCMYESIVDSGEISQSSGGLLERL